MTALIIVIGLVWVIWGGEAARGTAQAIVLMIIVLAAFFMLLVAA